MSEFIRGKTLKTDCELIQLLGIENECWQYDMSRRLDKSYRTIMRRVAELEDLGLVQVVRRERSKNRGKQRKIYGLTFRGALAYLALEKIPKQYGESGESPVAFKKRYFEQKKRFLWKLRTFFVYYGKLLDYEVFKQVPWFVERYGPIIYREILHVAQGLRVNLLSTRELTRRKELVEKHLWMQKFTGFDSQKTTWKIDYLAQVEDELALAKAQIKVIYKKQEEQCKQSFALGFFKKVAYLKTTGKMHNKRLHRLVEQLLICRREIYESELDALTKLVAQYH